jgi:hypothetical protein
MVSMRLKLLMDLESYTGFKIPSTLQNLKVNMVTQVMAMKGF